MKVRDLICALCTIDPDREVVLSKDGEGNSFSPLSDCSQMVYVPESSWHGYVCDEDELPEEVPEGMETKPALVLWPTN